MGPPTPQTAYGYWGSLVLFTALLGVGFGLLAHHGFDPEAALDTIAGTDPFLFVVAIAVLPLFGFPIAVCYLFAGAVFPWFQAWLVCAVGLAVNIAAAYWAGQYILRRPLTDWLLRRGHTLPKLNELGHFRVIFLVRAVPGIPFPVQNYLLAVIGAPFPLYFLLSWSIQTTIAAGMTALPHLLLEGSRPHLLVGAGILLILLVGKLAVARRSRYGNKCGTRAPPP
ncbi:MAG: VTT domain-containing protein [Opitutales bacterium]|nr:VTT domain-containing protein [Opitutales bacterium]